MYINSMVTLCLQLLLQMWRFGPEGPESCRIEMDIGIEVERLSEEMTEWLGFVMRWDLKRVMMVYYKTVYIRLCFCVRLCI